METVGTALRIFFAEAVYPLIVILTCLLIFGTVVFVTTRARTARAVIAAVVPIVALPFLVVAHASVGDPVMQGVGSLPESARFLLGVLAAVALIEVGQVLLRKTSEIGPALFILILGSAGTFFVYALMSGSLSIAHFVFFGFAVGGGVYMVFRGAPLPERMLRDWPFGTNVRKAFTQQPKVGPSAASSPRRQADQRKTSTPSEPTEPPQSN